MGDDVVPVNCIRLLLPASCHHLLTLQAPGGAGKPEGTKYTAEQLPKGVLTKGGSSWTKDWLKFDNSYFTEVRCIELPRC